MSFTYWFINLGWYVFMKLLHVGKPDRKPDRVNRKILYFQVFLNIVYVPVICNICFNYCIVFFEKSVLLIYFI